MYRGTTPTFTFTLPDTVDLTLAEKVYVTFASKDEEIIYTKTDDDIVVTAHAVSVYLSQEETLELDPQVKIQLNWLYDDEGTIKRASSNIVVISTKRNLIDEVLE